MKTRCRTCHAHVNWLVNDATQKRSLIDVEPTEKGNITINQVAGTYHVLTKRELAERIQQAQQPSLFAPEPPPLYISHFATCPQAKEHRQHTRAS